MCPIQLTPLNAHTAQMLLCVTPQLWRERGGITLKDTIAAEKRECNEKQPDPHFFQCVQGGFRVMILNGTLWATHGLREGASTETGVASSFGTRDGVLLMALLKIIDRFRDEIPDVDVVFQPMDRAKVVRPKHPDRTEVLPLVLSFGVHPEFLDVGIPDPSFWSWPEMDIKSQWTLLGDADVLPWGQKQSSAFWRGGVSRHQALRSRLVSCQGES